MSIERQLLRRLSRFTELSELFASFEVLAQRDWASALFVGTRFTLACVVDNDCDDFEQWLANLRELEIQLTGYFLASAELVERSAGRATIELLVIEEN